MITMVIKSVMFLNPKVSASWKSRQSFGVLLTVLMVLTAVSATADDTIAPPKMNFDAMNPGQIEGESIDPRTLSISWETKDLVIPGNGGLDIVVARSFAKSANSMPLLGNWDLEIPRIVISTTPGGALNSDSNGYNVCDDPTTYPYVIRTVFDDSGQSFQVLPGGLWAGPMTL